MSRHTIEAGEKPLGDIFGDKYKFRIPSYQRPYAWTTEQAGELFDDLFNACPVSGDINDAAPYFLGSIVLIKDPQRPDADVVDGQQRLTTLTILLSALRDLSNPEFAADIHGFICRRGSLLFGNKEEFRLVLRERDAAFFRKTIQNQKATDGLPEPRLFRDSQARLVENAILMRDRLSGLTSEARQRLATFLALRCYLVIVAASDEASAFRIFSVMNSRGLDLSPADILKSELIGKLPPHQQDEYTEKWEEIEDELGRERFAELIGHIRMIHRKQKMQGTLIAEFREHVKTRDKPDRFIDNELEPYADAFLEISDRRFESYKNATEINDLLTHLSRLDNFDWQPPAIEVIARHREDPDFILNFLRDLDRLAYGLFLMRADTTERIRRYGKVLTALQGDEDIFAEPSALQLTEDEKKAISGTLKGDIYTITRIRVPLLLRLDACLSQLGTSPLHGVLSVEHVLPQNPSSGSQWLTDFPDDAVRQKWVHKLANLVLLTHRKNAQASNFDFIQKQEKYFISKGGVSNYPLTSQVLAADRWTPDTLEQRQKELIGKLEELWRLK